MSSFEEKDRSNLDAWLFTLGLDRAESRPLHAQLSDALREGILQGQAPAGHRLPASRTLSAELSVSRMTVQTAYDQLLAEGYLEARQGAGTYVARDLPHLAPPRQSGPDPAQPALTLPPDFRPFQPGIPDSSAFPYRAWARCLERAWQRPEPALLGPGDPLGWPPLRQAIADHLAAWRGISCAPAQVVITSGAAEAFDIVFRLCLSPGDTVLIEDPGYAPLRHGLERAGLTALPHRVDGDGLDIATVPGTPIACAIVTPSRHFPTGATLPLARRLALLEWAARNACPVIEDDYDGEFRYRGHPLPALAGLDQIGQVFYLGSFSKLLSPSLRLGYLVIPAQWLDKATATFTARSLSASLVAQPALAELMASGAFATHLRRMRRLYAKRQQVLTEALAQAPDLIAVSEDPAGMHLTCPLGPALRDRVTDRQIAAQGAAHGLTLRALSTHSVLPDPPQGLVLGYAGFDEKALTQAAETLLGILHKAA